MDKEDEYATIAVIVCVGFIIVFICIALFPFFNTTTITIDEEITNVVPVLNDEGGVEYLDVTFANNETYKLSPYLYGETIDLTVSSGLIIEIHYSERLIWKQDYWIINKIIKVPGGVGGE